MAGERLVDLVDAAAFALVPPCADPRFDHRSCDYWEDADRGSKAPRALGAPAARPSAPPAPLAHNPFAPAAREPAFNPFLERDDDAVENPFLPRRTVQRPVAGPDAPRKLQLLTRGAGIFGSYGKVLLVDEVPVAYAQFGPLSAYPRAMWLRDLYPRLPQSPLPAVITCIATTAEARHAGHARRLVAAVVADLEGRGFAAIETYPEAGAAPEATSAATPGFWESLGFVRAIDDERYPVFRLELA